MRTNRPLDMIKCEPKIIKLSILGKYIVTANNSQHVLILCIFAGALCFKHKSFDN